MKAYLITITTLLLFSSCKQFIEIEPPRNSLVPATVFKSNDLATSAVAGLYQQLSVSGFASGDGRSITTICGLSADEFMANGDALAEIANNQIIPENVTVASLWGGFYARIYNVNSVLNGLESSTQISPVVKAQLQGEVLFIRALSYFYLVNLYGAVPLNLVTDYTSNSKAGRAAPTVVYQQIIKDLETAEALLIDRYPTTERVRVNKSAAQALLARVYLYQQNWPDAEKYASLVIAKNATYSLTALNQVFLSNSKETILQLVPPANSNTPAGSFLVLTTAPTTAQVSLQPAFVQKAFETNDQRKTTWIRSIVASNITYYYPYKYTVRSSTTVTEYTMVLRLAEQLLIRDEARAQLNNLNGAIDDLDAIRFRAGLPLIKTTNPGISQNDLLLVIQKERMVELFTEWGHRWLDLKRTGQANTVLSAIKPTWKPEYQLFPIPKEEIDRSPNSAQNTGY